MTRRDPLFGCLLWTGQLDPDGYGQRGYGQPRAHTAAWLAAGRELKPGQVIDHLCRRRNCVELTHLEAVTRSANELRKSWRYRCRRERCAAGHVFSDVGAAVTPEGGRLCRACQRALISRA